ncbi:hypothetical protein ACOJA0_03475 [Corynebacterium amycolatum]|jgi:hypothetical protein|uniref:Uncharacterized protein n=1 Tax=Corynebacterium lactis RW2-5 TaxID=1408189 RepID=A0A0K2H3R1_9CORY|nr:MULTISPECIES: hypothetical protein [Corynebacterium]ALA68672.1 hypothetical protein CLAC_09900 [Corynebacterium lactis RW2-5]MCQ9125538.1 hypothetical protein [Corynebacterium amycolatum]MCQ9128144.1 hypothetical protein [Corynebacterium amycolatum]MCQ9141735.1 hypothetical protein [Corynebacterium amycolatum]MCQ9170341.1 hypothetical protein [Corynebacterium amycolatum]
MTNLEYIMSRRKTPVIARSTDGRVIRATPIHDPSENFRKGWEQTGTALRKAMDHYGAMTR